MSIKSVNELCDALLESNVLHCTKCGQLLQPPVITIQGRLNVCQDCHRRHYSMVQAAAPNTLFDRLLGELDFACVHEYCSDRIAIKDYPAHVRYCRYKMIQCEKEKCQWRGMRKTYIDHVVTDHQANVVTGDSYEITGLVDFHMKTDVLRTSSGTFVSHAWLSLESCDVVLLDLGHTPKYSDFKVVMKVTEGSKSCYVTECSLIESNRILDGFAGHVSGSVSLEVLRNMFPAVPDIRSELPNIRLEFIPDGAIVAQPNMLDDLLCSHCNQMLTPPAYTCSTGTGNICSKCIVDDDRCSRCYIECAPTHINDKALNVLLPKVKYPCRFKDEGCPVQSLSIVDHESSCSHRVWECLECFDDFPEYSAFVRHVSEEHAENFLRSTEMYVSEQANRCGAPGSRTFQLGAYGRIFMITYECASPSEARHTCMWSVQHIGPKDNRFMFEVTISSSERPGRSIVLRNECYYNGETINWYKIGGPVLNEFRNANRQYAYCVRIMPYKP